MTRPTDRVECQSFTHRERKAAIAPFPCTHSRPLSTVSPSSKVRAARMPDFQFLDHVTEVIFSQMFGYRHLRYRQLHQSWLRSMQPSRRRRFPCPDHVWQ